MSVAAAFGQWPTADAAAFGQSRRCGLRPKADAAVLAQQPREPSANGQKPTQRFWPNSRASLRPMAARSFGQWPTLRFWDNSQKPTQRFLVLWNNP
jgi:hypothetical protein